MMIFKTKSWRVCQLGYNHVFSISQGIDQMGLVLKKYD
jgi:hypothetical protein